MVTPEEYRRLKGIADNAKSIEKEYIKDYVNNYIDEGYVTFVGLYNSIDLRLYEGAPEVTVEVYYDIESLNPGCPMDMPTTIEEATKMFEEQARTMKMMRQAYLALRYLTCD